MTLAGAYEAEASQRPWSHPRKHTGGASSRPRGSQRWVQIPRCARRIRNNIARWHWVGVGSSSPPPSGRWGWRPPSLSGLSRLAAGATATAALVLVSCRSSADQRDDRE